MGITRPLGFRAAGCRAGLKRSGKPDLALIVADESDRASSGAVFTSNIVVGATIDLGRAWRKAYMAGRAPPLRAVLINAGTANAATGPAGAQDAVDCTDAAAHALAVDPASVMASSTGVIGRRVPVDKVKAALPGLVAALDRGPDADNAAADAILTTDLVRKTAHREVEIDGHVVHFGGITKGSGMIAPLLDRAPSPPQATMLAFITTDAPFAPAVLQRCLEMSCARSFDRISVDAHPSCSDMAVAMSSGLVPMDPIRMDDSSFHAASGALRAVCEDLAEQIVRDGEGASRIFRVDVEGAESEDQAARIARAVVDSPLVKCAVHGKDPNWGRIVTAAGNAGIPFNPNDLTLTIGGVMVYKSGVPTDVAPNDETLVKAMSADRVLMRLRVGNGTASAWFLGCDLSNGYVTINAEYTT